MEIDRLVFFGLSSRGVLQYLPMADEPVLLHLLKLSPAISEKAMAELLETLWSTRRSGLTAAQKAHLQTLLGFSTTQDVAPVLACLRLLIRKSVHEKLRRDDIKKLFSLDLPIELQSLLMMLLQRYQEQWSEEASKDLPLWLHRKPLDAANAAPVIRPVLHSKLSSLWPIGCQNSCNEGAAIQNNAKPHTPTTDITCSHYESGSANISKVVPRLKSMTWTMDNRKSVPANQTAVITLMLQDYTQSSSRDTEVKFKVSRDTLESVLRSLAHVGEQLSNILNRHVESEPSLKKQKQ